MRPTSLGAVLPSFAQEFSDAAAEATPVGEVTSNGISSPSPDGKYTKVDETFQITLLGEVVPHVRSYRMTSSGGKTCFYVTQVLTDDQPKVLPGFDQIAATLELTGS